MVIVPVEQRTDDALAFPHLDRWIQRYLHDCEIQLHKPTTLTHYRNALKRFLTWYETRLPDGKITRRSAKDFGYWLSRVKQKYDDHPGRPTEQQNLSPATVRRTIGVVRTFLSWLYVEGYLPRDFAAWFPLPRVHQRNNRVISPDTLQVLLQGATQGEMAIRDVTLIALLADTGLRRKELANLRVEQIRWLSLGGKGYLLGVAGKGDRLRMVPFSAKAGKLLHQYLDYRQRLMILAGNVSHPHLFVQRNGKPLRPGSIYQILRRIAVRCGVEHEIWNTHALRHAFATYFWQTQRDTKSLSLILGHSSQKITEDIYVHPVPQDLMSAHTSLIVSGQVTPPAIPTSTRSRPTPEELLVAIHETPNWCALGERFGMSDRGVRKMAERYGLLQEYYRQRRRKSTS